MEILSTTELQAMAKFLSRNKWTFFITFTTRYKSSASAMRRICMTFFQHLNSKNSLKKSAFYFVLEKHKHRGYHCHGLVNYSDLTLQSDIKEIDIAFKNIIKSYQYSAGSVNSSYAMDGHHRNEIVIYDGKKGAIEYTLKYLKKQNNDWDYLVNGI